MIKYFLVGFFFLFSISSFCEQVEIVICYGKVLGGERKVMDDLFAKFEEQNPDIRVILRELPNASDKQHQYYLTSLGGGATDIDVMTIDIIWVSEFAHANWLVPFELEGSEREAFLKGPLAACTYEEQLVAIPWYTDSGLLYYRKDLLEKYQITIPETWTWEKIKEVCDTILPQEEQLQSEVKYGLICQGQHYEGLVCAFLEIFRGCGGEIMEGKKIVANSPQSIQAFQKFNDLIHKENVIPSIINNYNEPKSLETFSDGMSIFMRNWPYAWSNLQAPGSRWRGKIGVSPVPHLPGYESSATLGGWQLAVSSHSKYPKEAAKLVRFLTNAHAQKNLAIYLARNPTLKSLYQDEDVLKHNPFFKDLYQVFIHSDPRPVTPIYPKISQIVQREVSKIISNQQDPAETAKTIAKEIEQVLTSKKTSSSLSLKIFIVPCILIFIVLGSMIFFKGSLKDNLAALAYLSPALLVIIFVALLPLLYSIFIAFYHVEMANIIRPSEWLSSGITNFTRIFSDVYFGRALFNTFAISIVAVTLELVIGLGIALLLTRSFIGRGITRSLVLLPWIIPTVVAGKMWSWIFSTDKGIVNNLLMSSGIISSNINWSDPVPAFISIVVAEVWKTAPFMAILLLAGLTTISQDLYRSARMDGASAWYTFTRITLPLLRPTIFLALLFRTMDSLRIFDVVYSMTESNEATKTLSIYVHQQIGAGDIGYASALSFATFVIIFFVSIIYLSLMGKKIGVKS